MKTYVVYVNGEEVGMLKAAHHNAAEKKAKAKFGSKNPGKDVAVEYTEI